MASRSEKNWATEYLINPLHEPTPAEDTGLAGSVAPKRQPSVKVQSTGSSTSTNPFRRVAAPDASEPGSPNVTKSGATSHTRAVSSGSASGSRDSPRRSADVSRGPPLTYQNSVGGNRPRRSSSLREKFPGDPSAHPLDQLTKEAQTANHSPHLKKKHVHGADSIDKLDSASILGTYHHEGPYDAASLARNNGTTSSPVAALRKTNREALKATPRENVEDSLRRHRPLDGVSSVPPGETDRFGRTYNYREGREEDMMRNGKPEGGAYKQWPGIDYLPEDLKGKGEPSYTIEEQLKTHKRNTRSSNGNEVELVDRSRRSGDEERSREDMPAVGASSSTTGPTTAGLGHREWDNGHRRNGSGSGLEGLKKRIGSLKRK